VKISAALNGFRTVFPEFYFECTGTTVESGVPEQPVGLTETQRGAHNRVENLRKAVTEADYYVGIEGGIREENNDWYAFAWVWVENRNGQSGKAQTGHFQLPPGVIKLIQEGHELGHANDLVFGTENSKQKSGAVGILTDNAIDREKYYLHAMILALIPFRKNKLF